MNNQETTALFKIASSFAERTYKELFAYYPDPSNEATRELLGALQQAWLSGYNYLRMDTQLSNTIEEIFGFYVESE